MRGWIKLHRKIKDHWLWKDPVKFQWWITMLLEVNYTEGKMMLGNNLITISRGSSTNSLRTWADLFRCGTKATTNFFDLLESDGMITRRTLGKGKHSTTLIIITNYEEYQTDKETLTDTQAATLTDTQGKHKGHTIEERKKVNNLKKEKKSDARALDFLRRNFQDKFNEEFLKKYESEIRDKKDFAEGFDNTVEIELSQGKISMEVNELLPRLKNYARNWIKNQNKTSKSHNKNEKSSNYKEEGGAGKTSGKTIRNLSDTESWSANRT